MKIQGLTPNFSRQSVWFQVSSRRKIRGYFVVMYKEGDEL